MIRNTVRLSLQCRYTCPEERLQKEKKKRRQTRFSMGWTLFDHKESRKRFLRATIMWKRSCYHNSKS